MAGWRRRAANARPNRLDVCSADTSGLRLDARLPKNPALATRASGAEPVSLDERFSGIFDGKERMNSLQLGDCVAGMNTLPAGSVDLAFADPPFNIGYN